MVVSPRKRRVRSGLALAALALALTLQGLVADAHSPAEYEEKGRFRLRWAPMVGTVEGYVGAAGWGGDAHRVHETFTWLTAKAMNRLDSPRVPPGEGTYEHELFVKDNPDTHDFFCKISDGNEAHSFRTDLPEHSWYDNTRREANEATWGMHAELLLPHYQYSIDFACGQEGSTGQSNRIKVNGQIGHCRGEGHVAICGEYSAIPDKTTFLIPDEVGVVSTSLSDVSRWRPSFNLDYSFDQQVGQRWTIGGGGATRIRCWGEGTGPRNAFHGPCYLLMSPGEGQTAAISYKWWSPDTVHVVDPLTEFTLRCPITRSTDCLYGLAYDFINESGKVDRPCRSEPIPRNPNGDWKGTRVQSTAKCRGSFAPVTARGWQFKLFGEPGQQFDVDYTKQWYCATAGDCKK